MVKSSDVQTISYELNPDYTYDNKTRINKVTSYTATQIIRVTLKQISNVGKFLDDIIMDSKKPKVWDFGSFCDLGFGKTR